MLKRYELQSSQDDYDTELETFRFLSNRSIKRESQDIFIGFYGSFLHGRFCNVILEHADEGTLEDMFKKSDPPKTRSEQVHLWKSVFGLVKALKILHSTELNSPDNTTYTYTG